MRQSRSFMSSSDFSDQCVRVVCRSSRSRWASSASAPAAVKFLAAHGATGVLPRLGGRRHLRVGLSRICARRSIRAGSRGRTGARPRGVSYSRLRSWDVSWSLSQSNLNLNLSAGRASCAPAPHPVLVPDALEFLLAIAFAFTASSFVVARAFFLAASFARPLATAAARRRARRPRRCAATSSSRRSAAASRSFLLMNVGLADASASARCAGFFRERGCVGVGRRGWVVDIRRVARGAGCLRRGNGAGRSWRAHLGALRGGGGGGASSRRLGTRRGAVVVAAVVSAMSRAVVILLPARERFGGATEICPTAPRSRCQSQSRPRRTAPPRPAIARPSRGVALATLAA